MELGSQTTSQPARHLLSHRLVGAFILSTSQLFSHSVTLLDRLSWEIDCVSSVAEMTA